MSNVLYTIEATIKTVVAIEAASCHEARDIAEWELVPVLFDDGAVPFLEQREKFHMSQWLINPDREKYDVEITDITDADQVHHKAKWPWEEGE